MEGENPSAAPGPLQPTPIRSLPLWRVLAYGVGHFHNDMCASMWFTYLLIYTTHVLGLSSAKAGALIFIGQAVDAISTPLIGIESDRTDVPRRCLTYGRRRIWHFVGFMCVICSFAFLFVECLGCVYGKTSSNVVLAYYVPFVAVFQFGWACVQISHMALIPELSTCQHERATLNGVRYAFTVVANITVFALVLLFVGMVDAGQKAITHNDGKSFSHTAFAVTGIGFIVTLFFYVGTKEPEVTTESDQVNFNETGGIPPSEQHRTKMIWKDWLKLPDFYMVGMLYMSTRLFGNITQAYLPLYILETQHFDKKYIAIVPMIVYVSSFVTSTILSFQLTSRFIPRKIFLLFGVLLGVGTCTWMWFHELHKMVYAVSVLLGTSCTILLVVSLSLIADLIGSNTETGAFVYGTMSFADKISTGLAVQIIQSLQPDCSTMPCISDDYFFRGVMVYVPGGALIIVLVGLLMLWPRNIGERRFQAVQVINQDS